MGRFSRKKVSGGGTDMRDVRNPPRLLPGIRGSGIDEFV
jgi:hypothetical protein